MSSAEPHRFPAAGISEECKQPALTVRHVAAEPAASASRGSPSVHRRWSSRESVTFRLANRSPRRCSLRLNANASCSPGSEGSVRTSRMSASKATGVHVSGRGASSALSVDWSFVGRRSRRASRLVKCPRGLVKALIDHACQQLRLSPIRRGRSQFPCRHGHFLASQEADRPGSFAPFVMCLTPLAGYAEDFDARP